MEKRRSIPLDFEVDKITNSIENVVTKDSFATSVVPFTLKDNKLVAKKDGWVFDWKYELNQPDREVYKLVITNHKNSTPVIQGLLSIEIKSDHVYMHLLESAPFNKGKAKVYSGVPGNLVAFACELSFQRGFDGNVSFISKSKLVDHYIETLGAIHFGGRTMIIGTVAASKLVNKYFKK